MADCTQRNSNELRLRACSALIKENPNISEKVYFNRGEADHAKGDRERAIAGYTQSIKLSPSCRAYGYRAQAHMELGKFDLAIADATKGKEVEPSDEFCPRMRGKALCGSKDYTRGIAKLTAHMKELPKEKAGIIFLAYVWRGDCHESKGDTAAALDDYNNSLRRVDTSAAYLGRAKVYERIGDKEKAIADYQSALRSVQLLGANDYAVARERLEKLGVR